MHDQLRHLIIGSSLVLGACDLEDEYEIEQPELEQPTEHESIDEVEAPNTAEPRLLAGFDQDCVDVNAPVIVRIDPTTTTCNFVGFANFDANWDFASLFEEGSPMLENLGINLPLTSPLREFCRYDYTGVEAQRDAAYTNLLSHLHGPNAPTGVEGDTAAVDCPVIAPMTDQGLDTAAGRAALHEAFMSNIHAVEQEDLPASSRRAMKVVLLDTVAQGFAPHNEHGLYLEDLMADIACPGDTEACKDMIEHVLVTPRLPNDDYAQAEWRGGSVGYMHEFSMGLAFAVLDWGKDNLPLPLLDRQRLVVSAAVGADPNHPLASDPNFAPAQSAIVALEAAYCMGAVVYAAAGNTRDNRCPKGEQYMLAPASYEEFAVPSQSQCALWGYVADYPAHTFQPGSPLIHAVGGLDGLDEPIANHRRLAHPRLHATATNALSEDGTVAVTGTSIATAVAASAHFLLWSYDRQVSGALVAEHIYETGYDIGSNADSGMHVGQPIRRLGICQALEDQLNLACDQPDPDPDGYLGDFALAVDDAIAVADNDELLIGLSTVYGKAPECGAGPQLDVFVVPQPERPACSNCNGVKAPAGNTHMLNMSIANQAWAVDLDVTAAYLHTYDAGGNATTFNLATVVPSINAANPYNVIQVPFEVVAPVSAVLEFVYYDAVNHTYTKQANPLPLVTPI
jgi:hypothetical protein